MLRALPRNFESIYVLINAQIGLDMHYFDYLQSCLAHRVSVASKKAALPSVQLRVDRAPVVHPPEGTSFI